MEIGKYTLENEIDCKCIADGWEIFPSTVDREGITPGDFSDAEWSGFGSIIVYKD